MLRCEFGRRTFSKICLTEFNRFITRGVILVASSVMQKWMLLVNRIPPYRSMKFIKTKTRKSSLSTLATNVLKLRMIFPRGCSLNDALAYCSMQQRRYLVTSLTADKVFCPAQDPPTPNSTYE